MIVVELVVVWSDLSPLLHTEDTVRVITVFADAVELDGIPPRFIQILIGEAEECFGAERAETQRLQKDRQRSPVTRPRHRCARIALEKLPQHRDRHLTAGLVEEDGGHQEPPGVVKQRLLHQIEGRARRGPLLEGLALRRTESAIPSTEVWTRLPFLC